MCAVIPVASQRTHGTTFRALKVSSQVPTTGAKSAVYDYFVIVDFWYESCTDDRRSTIPRSGLYPLPSGLVYNALLRLLTGIANSQMERLQAVQNAAARLMSEAYRRDHAMPSKAVIGQIFGGVWPLLFPSPSFRLPLRSRPP